MANASQKVLSDRLRDRLEAAYEQFSFVPKDAIPQPAFYTTGRLLSHVSQALSTNLVQTVDQRVAQEKLKLCITKAKAIEKAYRTVATAPKNKGAPSYKEVVTGTTRLVEIELTDLWKALEGLMDSRGPTIDEIRNVIKKLPNKSVASEGSSNSNNQFYDRATQTNVQGNMNSSQGSGLQFNDNTGAKFHFGSFSNNEPVNQRGSKT